IALLTSTLCCAAAISPSPMTGGNMKRFLSKQISGGETRGRFFLAMLLFTSSPKRCMDGSPAISITCLLRERHQQELRKSIHWFTAADRQPSKCVAEPATLRSWRQTHKGSLALGSASSI